MRDGQGRHVEVHVACGSAAEADAIATVLVERRLAACVQQLPIRSTYRWRGAIEREDEVLLLVKTIGDRYADVEAAVRELHSYEVPAITCLAIDAGNADYLRWLVDETR